MFVVGGFAYGAFTTLALHRGARNWLYGALFLLLASSWMMGMMVNPLEQPHFLVCGHRAGCVFSALVRHKKVATASLTPANAAPPS